jgi:hypothetical protein
MKITSAWTGAFDILLDAYQQLAKNLPMLEQYESFFITDSETTSVLALIYEEVLNFHLAAWKLFAMPGETSHIILPICMTEKK